jgi:hypothetical protein
MRGDAKVLACLIETTQQVWDDIKEDVMNKLIITMKRRAQAALDAEGWYTIY